MKQARTKRKSNSRRSRKKKSQSNQLINGLRDERIPKIFGIIACLFGVYLFLAFLSYLDTWQQDQDKVLHANWSLLLNQEVQVDNWLGRFGAFSANKFIYWGFGISSFAFVYLFIRGAYGLFFSRPNRFLYETIRQTGSILLYCSPLAAFLAAGATFPWGGAFGDYVTMWLVGIFGQLGTALWFLFIGIAFITWNFYQMTLEQMNKVKMPAVNLFRTNQKRKKEHVHEEENVTEEQPIETTRLPDEYYEEKEALPLLSEPTPAEDVLDLESTPQPEKQQKDESSDGDEVKEGLKLELEEILTDTAVPAAEQSLEIEEKSIRETPEMVVERENSDHLEPYDPTLELSSFKSPDVDLLTTYEKDIEINREELEANKDQIVNTLKHYNIEITRIRATVGPTVTLYEIVPAPGVRISRIKNLEDDIALSLAALGIRIIAPIPGKGTIGIEVPNRKKQIVGLKEILASEKFQNAKMDLPIALGKTISNEVFIADLAKMPHLLIAGATGQGKSVGINAILTSLLYKKHPSQLKFVLVDPKKVELFPYSELNKHFLASLPDLDEPIITDNKIVIQTLNSLCIEMDQRYDLLKKAHARNIKEYNGKFTNRRLNPNNGHRFLPYIVLVIDEFADLIMTSGKEVELSIARLAQLARAVGIHLIIATQRPSVNIITGVIKANFPARIAYRVASKVDSRTILDAGGADQLIGRGDMLLSVGGDMIRLQCAFVDTPEVERVLQYISGQSGYPEPYFLPEYTEEGSDAPGAISALDLDDQFEDAARLIVQNQHGSTSMIQRRMKLGYNRAGRIMDQLEAMGVVGPNEGSKAREVLILNEAELMQHLEQMRAKV